MMALASLVLQFDSKEEVFPQAVCSHDQGNVYLSTSPDGIFQYTFYYPSNPAIGIFGQCFPTNKLFGYHEHDIERLTLYQGGYIHMSAHGHTQGTWTSLLMLDEEEEGRYIIYVSRGSHAMYPRKGTVWRGFGFANDKCDGLGKKMTVDISTACPSYNYKIANGFHLYKEVQNPSQDVITPVQRILIPMSL
jgi:Vacuolar protein sorting-associated protein 62